MASNAKRLEKSRWSKMQTYARFFSKTNQVMTVEALLYGFDASDKKYAENV